MPGARPKGSFAQKAMTSVGRHIKFTEHRRVDCKDVRHRKECRDTGEDFGPHGRLGVY